MKFVLNDENKTNSYGFRVLTKGIDLDRFSKNPVMLNNHSNNTKDVLGAWRDVSKRDGVLLATPEFDTEDVEGKEVVRKVKSGKLKGVSIGILFKKEDLKLIGNDLVLTKCELTEASIVAVPSNANAIALYNIDGELLTENEVKQICLSIQENQQLKINMDKELLGLLGLDENAEQKEVNEALKGLTIKLSAVTAEKAALQKQVDDYQEAEAQRTKVELSALVEDAVKTGKINATAKESFIALGLENAKKVIEGIPARKSIAEQLKSPEAKLATFEKMSWDELDRGDHLENLKLNHFEYFQERYKEKFGKEYKN